MFTQLKKAIKQAVTMPLTAQGQQRVIEQIHNEFDTAADTLLKQAGEIIAKGLSEQKIDLSNKLQAAGFVNVSLVSKTAEQKHQLSEAEWCSSIVLKYKEKYPQYKFITKGQVLAICAKYGLVFGPVERYTGDVPVKNIEEIAAFKVADEDKYFFTRRNDKITFAEEPGLSAFEHKFYNESMAHAMKSPNNGSMFFRGLPQMDYVTPHPFYICAPMNQMKMREGEVIKDNQIFKIEVPDPIVLHFVGDGYLIVSKWGLEAEDELLK